MENRRNLLVVAALALPAAACSSLTTPVVEPSTATDATVTQAFSLAQIALLAVQMIPGVSSTITTAAQNALSALQAAYTQYTAAPAGSTTEQAALLAAISAANTFLQSNGLPAMLTTAAGQKMSARVILLK